MKTPIPCTLLLAAPLAALAFLPGCVTEDNQGTRYSLASPGGYNTYAALPVDYTGDAYYYNNRYYAGGRYEPGTYSYQGRTYTNRYFYDGQYIYGGDYRQQPVSNSYGTPRGGASTSTRYVTYRELPKDYSGDAYYYNNRYYAGGRYEPGTYSYQGRTYDNRYFHNGQYIYGGDYRQSASVVSPQRYGERARSTYRNISR